MGQLHDDDDDDDDDEDDCNRASRHPSPAIKLSSAPPRSLVDPKTTPDDADDESLRSRMMMMNNGHGRGWKTREAANEGFRECAKSCAWRRHLRFRPPSIPTMKTDGRRMDARRARMTNGGDGRWPALGDLQENAN